jgi:hypothetical protein
MTLPPMAIKTAAKFALAGTNLATGHSYRVIQTPLSIFH